MSEFQQWREEQKHRDQAARGIQAPASPAQTITSAVAVPALQAGLVGVAIAVLGGGLALLFGAGWLLAGKVAIGAWLVGTSGSTVYFVLQERAIHITPALAIRAKMALAEPAPMPEPEDVWRTIRPYHPRLAATVAEQTVAAIEPETDSATRELHQFICDTWDGGQGNLSRAACRQRGHQRAEWERLVGGRRHRAGSESGRGILDRAGVIEQMSSGWQWRAGVTLQDVFNITPELARYADARARMVQGRRDRTDGTGQDRDDTTSGVSRAE